MLSLVLLLQEIENLKVENDTLSSENRRLEDECQDARRAEAVSRAGQHERKAVATLKAQLDALKISDEILKGRIETLESEKKQLAGKLRATEEAVEEYLTYR